MSKSHKFLLVLPILMILLTTSCYGGGAVDCRRYDDPISRSLDVPRKPLLPERDGVEPLIPESTGWIIVFAFALLGVVVFVITGKMPDD